MRYESAHYERHGKHYRNGWGSWDYESIYQELARSDDKGPHHHSKRALTSHENKNRHYHRPKPTDHGQKPTRGLTVPALLGLESIAFKKSDREAPDERISSNVVLEQREQAQRDPCQKCFEPCLTSFPIQQEEKRERQ